jgi:hypothetical protein
MAGGLEFCLLKLGDHINKGMVSQIKNTISHSCILLKSLKKRTQKDILFLL